MPCPSSFFTPFLKDQCLPFVSVLPQKMINVADNQSFAAGNDQGGSAIRTADGDAQVEFINCPRLQRERPIALLANDVPLIHYYLLVCQRTNFSIQPLIRFGLGWLRFNF
jgi:hypothetical protein